VRPSRGARDAGSAVVDFALVGALLVGVVLALLQLAIAVHVRTTVVASAAEGAREAATAGGSVGSGVRRTQQLLRDSLPASYSAHVTGWYEDVGGLRSAAVQVRTPLPVIGLVGPSADITVVAHSPVEPR
jgi:Flp pilus assembly protein TadG